MYDALVLAVDDPGIGARFSAAQLSHRSGREQRHHCLRPVIFQRRLGGLRLVPARAVAETRPRLSPRLSLVGCVDADRDPATDDDILTGCCLVVVARSVAGGFLEFQASYRDLCEDKSRRCPALTSLSQPCLPTTNVGPTRILPFLYLGSQQDANNKELLAVINPDSSFRNRPSTRLPKFLQKSP